MKLFWDEFHMFNDYKIIWTNFSYVLKSVKNSILAYTLKMHVYSKVILGYIVS
jgi:hypothetical protein